MNHKSSDTFSNNSFESIDKDASVYESVRQFLESLSKEQTINQELISSIGFSLRSFNNLDRFLELVPLIASRLVGVKAAILVPFLSDGRISNDHIQAIPEENLEILIRQIINFEDGNVLGFANHEGNLEVLDNLVQNSINSSTFFFRIIPRAWA